jgi:hypothetical protein
LGSSRRDGLPAQHATKRMSHRISILLLVFLLGGEISKVTASCTSWLCPVDSKQCCCPSSSRARMPVRTELGNPRIVPGSLIPGLPVRSVSSDCCQSSPKPMRPPVDLSVRLLNESSGNQPDSHVSGLLSTAFLLRGAPGICPVLPVLFCPDRSDTFLLSSAFRI